MGVAPTRSEPGEAGDYAGRVQHLERLAWTRRVAGVHPSLAPFLLVQAFISCHVDVLVPRNQPMALPKSNQQPDPKPFPLLRPWQKTAEQKIMMR